MKYYPRSKSILIRTLYEDTYENFTDYYIDTMMWKNRVDELHTIWCKSKDPSMEAQK